METYMQIDGLALSAQQTTEVDDLQNRAAAFVGASRQVTRAIEDFLGTVAAYQGDYAAHVAAASPQDRLTVSPRSHRVAHLLSVLKGALSYAVVVGMLDEGAANAMLQAWAGAGETIVGPTEIKPLLDTWR